MLQLLHCVLIMCSSSSAASIVVVELFGFYSAFKTFLNFMCVVHAGFQTSLERTNFFLKMLKFLFCLLPLAKQTKKWVAVIHDDPWLEYFNLDLCLWFAAVNFENHSATSPMGDLVTYVMLDRLWFQRRTASKHYIAPLSSSIIVVLDLEIAFSLLCRESCRSYFHDDYRNRVFKIGIFWRF